MPGTTQHFESASNQLGVCFSAVPARLPPISFCPHVLCNVLSQALAFYRLTHPKSSSQHAHGPTVGQLRPPRHGRRRVPAAHGSGNTATAPGPTLPHAIACGGEFSGIVYSSPASLWRREDTVGNWPPTSDPTQGSFRAWEASLAQGTLVLRPILPPPGAKPPSPGRGAPEQPGQQGKRGAAGEGVPDAASPSAAAAAGAGAGPAEPAAELVPPTKVGIPLDGCLVELVADGLRGRSEFIRRAPLLISHPRWKLLEGEPAFYLWAGEAQQAAGLWCWPRRAWSCLDNRPTLLEAKGLCQLAAFWLCTSCSSSLHAAAACLPCSAPPADDPASKQQWLHALGWWCQDAEKLRAVEAMYGAYCEAMRDRSILEYAEQAPPGGAGSHGPAAAEDAGGGGGSEAGPDGQALALVAATGEQRQAKQRGWKGWGASKVQNMRRKMTQKQRDGSQDGADSSGAGGGPFASPGKQGGGPRGSTPPSLDPSPAKGELGCQPGGNPIAANAPILFCPAAPVARVPSFCALRAGHVCCRSVCRGGAVSGELHRCQVDAVAQGPGGLASWVGGWLGGCRSLPALPSAAGSVRRTMPARLRPLPTWSECCLTAHFPHCPLPCCRCPPRSRRLWCSRAMGPATAPAPGPTKPLPRPSPRLQPHPPTWRGRSPTAAARPAAWA